MTRIYRRDFGSFAERFFKKVVITPSCWWWFGSMSTAEYGYFLLDGKIQPAHRVVMKLMGFDVPDTMEVDHLCRKSLCVNPEHLEVVTPAENKRRAIANRPKPVACPRNHLYTAENSYHHPDGRVSCKECHRQVNREWQRQYRQKARQAASTDWSTRGKAPETSRTARDGTCV